MKKHISFFFALLILFSADIFSQRCCYTDNYSSSTPWIMNGSYYSIGPTNFSFNGTPGASYNYATHSLSCTLSNTLWSADIEFKYTGRGVAGVGHTLLGVTAGTQNAWNTGVSYSPSNQAAIEAYILCPSWGNQDTDSIFAHAKSGTIWNTSSAGIAVSLNTVYYMRLERLSANQGRISLFLDFGHTIHAPGSPRSFSVPASTSGLMAVQHGCIPQGSSSRSLTGTLDNLNICDSLIVVSPSCCYTDNYSNSANWLMNGTGYSIGPGSFDFNATPGAAYNYATRQFNCSLSDSNWAGHIEFTYSGRGSTGTGHTILGVTSGIQNAWNTGISYASSNQDAIETYITCPAWGAQNTDSVFAHAKRGSTWNTSSNGIAVLMNTTYYIRLERLSRTQGKINLFLDAARTIHAPGSPQTFPVFSTTTGLQVVQHGVIPQGYSGRALTGSLRNLNICDNYALSIFQKWEDPQKLLVYPNPFNSSATIQFNTILNNAELNIYTLYGQKIKTLNNISGEKIKIDRDSLPCGLYFIRLIQDSKTIITEKLIISD